MEGINKDIIIEKINNLDIIEDGIIYYSRLPSNNYYVYSNDNLNTLELNYYNGFNLYYQLQKFIEHDVYDTVIRQIGHDISNQLTSLYMNNSYISDNLNNFETYDANLKKNIIDSIEGIKKASTKIEDLINYYRTKFMDKHKFSNSLHDINVLNIINFIFSIANIESYNGEIIIILPDNFKSKLSQIELSKVIYYLLKNAIEARNDGIIIININKVQNKFILEFIDNGPGIENNKQRQVFKPMFSNKIGHIGYGLTAVRSMIFAKKLKLDVISDEYNIIRFTLT